ncbi:MAG: fibronectin type III domain-containing protein [Intestinibaculum porci]|uniref:fibronectin type III domain-containing protein n=1 Tax=Intestinibaculum porci TaxID=2487118 RepID=UPI003F02FFA8
MIGKIIKVFLTLTMVFSLMLVKNNVYAAESNLEGEQGLFTKPDQIHEDEDLLSELNVIGDKLDEKQVKDGIDLYRWLYDIIYLNSEYSNAVSSSRVSSEVNKALNNIPFETKDEDGKMVYTGDQYYSNIKTNLKSLMREIKGEKPFESLRKVKDEQILRDIKSGKSLSDLRENPKMTIDDETYFNKYYQIGKPYKEHPERFKDYGDWINCLTMLNNKYPNSSVSGFLSSALNSAYDNGLSNYYDQIYGALNSLWDQTHYDFAHVTSNTLDSIEIKQNPSVTTYTDGETFNDNGLVIDGTYKQVWSDGRSPTTYTVNSMKYTTDTSTKLTYFDNNGNHITSWPVTVNDGVTSKTVNVPITVKAKLNSTKLTSISIASQPKKTAYTDGDAFKTDGLSIKGTFAKTYSDGSVQYETKDNMDYSISNSSLSVGQTAITATVTSDGVTKSVDIPVTVNAKLDSTKLSSIKIASNPTKLTYNEGDTFDDTGLAITGTYEKDYSDGSKQYYDQANMSYTVVDGDSLKSTQKSVKVRVNDDGVEKTVEIPVTVNKVVKEASIDQLYFVSHPNKVKYKAGDKITTKGMKVNAVIKKTMSDGSTVYETKKNVKVITSYPYAVAQIGSTVLTITYKYNENGFNDSKDLTQTIEVNKKDTHLVNVDKPAKVKIKSIKAGKKKFTVKWKKAKHARKYKVYYRVKGTKKWKSKSVKKTSCTVKKLKSKKTYQVRVRAINLTLKGKYSKTKTVKVK